MKTVIYLDELLLINFLIAAFLLPGAGLLCGANCRARRIAGGAALAAASSLLLLAPKLPFVLQLALKAGCAAVCVRVGFGRQQLRQFLRLCAWYLLLNLTLAGVVSGLILTRSPQQLQTNNLMVYLQLSPLVLLGCVSAVYLVLRLLLWCFERPRPGTAVPLTIALCDTNVTVQAFCDTGFSLHQPDTARSGIMVGLPSVRQQLPPPLREYLDAFFAVGGAAVLQPPQPQWRLRFVSCTTAAGVGLYPAVLSDRVTLTRGGRRYVGKALVIFCTQSFPYGCGAAYSPDFPDGAQCVRLQQGGTKNDDDTLV